MLSLLILDKYSDIGWFITKYFFKIWFTIISVWFGICQKNHVKGNWYQTKMSKWSKDGLRTFVFIKTCFTFQKMLIVEQTRGIKREILCFKSGEERIIENGRGVFDFKGRKIAQNARTFIFTADKKPFQPKLSINKELRYSMRKGWNFNM